MKHVRIDTTRKLVAVVLLAVGFSLISSTRSIGSGVSDELSTQLHQAPVAAQTAAPLTLASSSGGHTEQVGSRCGLAGEGRITVRNDTGVTVYIEVRNRSLGKVGKDFGRGAKKTWPVCNGDDIVLRVSTATECGRTFIGESRSIKVYDQETAILGGRSFRFDRADWLQGASTAAGFALTYIAEGYGVPPQVLEELGVREAKLYRLCGSSKLTDLAQCGVAIAEYIPSDVYKRFKVDQCFSRR